MSEAWYVAFFLLLALSFVNAVGLVAVLRQVGVLHQRLSPMGVGDIGGPAIGARLPALDFDVVAGEPSTDAELDVYVLVSPGCSLCSEVIPGAASIARARRAEGVAVALITDAPKETAAAYAAEHANGVPLLRHDGVSTEFDIPAAPFALVARRDGDNFIRVMAGGVINTTEQLDDVVDLGLNNLAAFREQFYGEPAPAPPASGSLINVVLHEGEQP